MFLANVDRVAADDIPVTLVKSKSSTFDKVACQVYLIKKGVDPVLVNAAFTAAVKVGEKAPYVKITEKGERDGNGTEGTDDESPAA